MRPSPLLTLTTVTLLAAGASACSPFAGIEGEWTRGGRGHTRWQTLDGLCPGLGGGCNFEVPIAVGASVSLAVDGIDGAAVTAAFTGGIEGAGPVDFGEDRNTLVPIRIVAAGPGRTELSDDHGVIDSATVTGRVVTQLECGGWPVGRDLDWRMRDLVVGDVTLDSRATERELYLVCRASDASGPILSADAISWTIVSGSDALQIGSTGLFSTLGSSARGARIDAVPRAPGTAVVRATVGEVTSELTITIE